LLRGLGSFFLEYLRDNNGIIINSVDDAPGGFSLGIYDPKLVAPLPNKRHWSAFGHGKLFPCLQTPKKITCFLSSGCGKRGDLTSPWSHTSGLCMVLMGVDNMSNMTYCKVLYTSVQRGTLLAEAVGLLTQTSLCSFPDIPHF
jgi:hypothetical protein